jgi:hypothetical protein
MTHSTLARCTFVALFVDEEVFAQTGFNFPSGI